LKIVSIDISYKKPLAVCVLGDKGRLVSLTSIDPKNDIYHTANSVLEEVVKIGDSLVVTETPLMIHNINTAYMMARMHAMLEKGCRDAGLLFFGVHPITWQKKLLNPQKGDDRKKLSLALASKMLGREMTNNDLSDAFLIATFGYQNRKEILKAISGGKKFSEK
jgi:hypothetical protein